MTILFGREPVWDEPACLEGDETVSMYEILKERQVGLSVRKEEPGRAAKATSGEPAGAGSLSSEYLRDRARHRPNAYETEPEETRGLAKVLSAQRLWSGRRCSREVKASNIPLVVGFKAMRTVSC